MNRSIILIILIFSLFNLQYSCEKENAPGNNVIEVKLHGFLCGSAILEILTPSEFDNGEDGFKTHDGKKLDNVFTGGFNKCDDMAKVGNMKDGHTFKVEIVEKPQLDSNCVVCLALLLGPKTYHIVQLVD